MWETRVQSLGWKDPLQEEMATHPSILAWRFPWTEDPGGLQPMELQRVGHDWATNLLSAMLLTVFPFSRTSGYHLPDSPDAGTLLSLRMISVPQIPITGVHPPPSPPSLSRAPGHNACLLLTRAPNDSSPSRRTPCFICSLMAVGLTSVSAQGTNVPSQALQFCLRLTRSQILSAQSSFGGEWMRGEATQRGCAALGP